MQRWLKSLPVIPQVSDDNPTLEELLEDMTIDQAEEVVVSKANVLVDDSRQSGVTLGHVEDKDQWDESFLFNLGMI